MPDLDDVRRARAYLVRVAEPPAPALSAMVAEHGPVRAAELVADGDAPPAVAAELRPDFRAVRVHDTDLEDRQHGIRLLAPEDTTEWPTEQFRSATAAQGSRPWTEPLALWVRGSGPLPRLLDQAVSVTGARACTGYGQMIAAELGRLLAYEQITSVSGAAFGIDGAAQRGSLDGGGSTVAVLACGVDVPYPSGHAHLLRHIAEQGAIVSQYPPGTPPQHTRFLARNKIIAAFSPVLVVVEAGVRSGSLATAADALSQKRQVMAVPGPITSATSQGTNQLLHDLAAVAVTAPTDVIAMFGEHSRATTAPAVAPAG